MADEKQDSTTEADVLRQSAEQEAVEEPHAASLRSGKAAQEIVDRHRQAQSDAKLAFCLHAMPEVGGGKPFWVETVRSLFDPKLVDCLPIAAYTPVQGLREQYTPVFGQVFSRPVSERAQAVLQSWGRLKPWMLNQPGQEFTKAEGSSNSVDLTDVQLYMLARSSCLLVDVDEPVGIGSGVLLTFADQMGIDIIGVGSQTILNPWLVVFAPYKCHPAKDTLRKLIWG